MWKPRYRSNTRFHPGRAAPRSSSVWYSSWLARANLRPTLRPERLLAELLAQQAQFAAAARSGLGIAQAQLLEGVEHDARHNEAGVQLVVGGHDIPRRLMGAGRAQAFLVGLHVLLPILALPNIGRGKLPIFCGRFNPLQEAPALLILGKVQKEFDDAGAAAKHMLL